MYKANEQRHQQVELLSKTQSGLVCPGAVPVDLFRRGGAVGELRSIWKRWIGAVAQCLRLLRMKILNREVLS